MSQIPPRASTPAIAIIPPRGGHSSKIRPDFSKLERAQTLKHTAGMPKPLRIKFRGATYHVMSRGNRKGRIFEDDRDRRRFLSIIAEAVFRYQVECPSYSLMGNHYHLIVHTPLGNISEFMKLVVGTYTQYMNRRHGWTGHLVEGRFKSLLVDDTCYLRTAMAYIARNPVEAGLVARAELWKWSSFRGAMGLCKPEDFVAGDWLQRAFPSGTLDESRKWFADLVVNFPGDLRFDSRDVVFGDEGLKANVRELIGRTMYLSDIPRTYRALARPPLKELLAGCTRRERESAIIRAHVVYGYKLIEIALCLRVHQTTVSRILSKSRRSLRQFPE